MKVFVFFKKRVDEFYKTLRLIKESAFAEILITTLVQVV